MPSETASGQQEKREAQQEAVSSLATPVGPEERRRRLQRVNRQQMILRAVDVEKLIAPDHPARAIWELVGRLDLSGFTAEIESVEGEAGRPAYDPQLLISLWIHAYSEGVSSAREVARRCEYHPAYQWLTGWEVVNHHSLSDFRVRHQGALDELFAQVLGVLSADGLITLDRVMHDGTKVKAQASGKSFRREKTLREHLERARERVRAMGDPRQEQVSARQAKAQERAARERVERLEGALEEMQKVQAAGSASQRREKRRVSETDPEARFMKQSGGGSAPSHNLQISTDAAHSLIVGVSVTQSVNDEGQLPGALEEVKRNLGRLPHQVVADAGFTTRETILEMAERQIDFIGGTVEAGGGVGRGLELTRRFVPRLLPTRPNATATSARRGRNWRDGEAPDGLGWVCCTTFTKRKRVTAEIVFFAPSAVPELRRGGSSASRTCRSWRPLWRRCRPRRRKRFIGCAEPWPSFPTLG